MRRMEDELKSALGRKSAPPDLVRKVMSALPAEPQRGFRRLRNRLSTFWLPWSLAGAAAWLLILFALFQYDGFLGRETPRSEHSQTTVEPGATTAERGEQARREVLLALQITGSKLQAVHQAIFRSTGSSQRAQDEN